MKKLALHFSQIATVFLILLLGSESFAYLPLGATEAMVQEAQQGQALVFNRSYSEAEKHFQNLVTKYPDSPLGSFGLMALYNAQMMENFDFSLEKKFKDSAQVNARIVDKIAKNPQASPWDQFLCGASHGLDGFFMMRRDQALKALSEAKAAEKCLNQAIAQAPQFQDAKLGQGMYVYWRSVFGRKIKILPFIKDQRQEGLALMREAAEKGSISTDLSRAALIFSLFQEKKPKEALPLIEEFLKKYPQNYTLKLLQGRLWSMAGKQQEAIAFYNELLQKYPQNTLPHYYKGEAWLRIRKIPEAKKSFQKFISSKPGSTWTSAYAHYRLGQLALKEKQRPEAARYFKAGYDVDSSFKPNLQKIIEMRQKK